MISDFEVVSAKTQAMVKNSLDALVNLDEKLAREVISADDEVDKLTKQFLKKTITAIEKEPQRTKDYFSIRSVSKNLERMADSATNIAEDVVYLCSGEIIRHAEELSSEESTDMQGE